MTLRIGDEAPDFVLRDQHGRRTSLRDFRAERAVVLVFYPFAFSGVCTGELRELRDQGSRIEEAGASVLAVSCDPMFSLRVFADQDGLDFPVLSDFWPHGEVSTAYGVFDDQLGCSRRSTFLVDQDGVLRWSVHSPMGEARSVDDYVREVEGLRGATDTGSGS